MDVEVGDRVRIDIPDETDENHRHHGKLGTVIRVLGDGASEVAGNPSDSSPVRIKLETGEKADFRPRDVRPSIE